MSDTATRRQRTADAMSPDHLPACPTCGDLCAQGADRCQCGARLYLTAGKGRARRSTPPPRPKRVAAVLPKTKAEEWWTTRYTAEELRELAAGL